MSRSTMDLVNDLREMADAQGGVVALVVGFENHSDFVFSASPDAEALDSLNTLVERGGAPIGLIGYNQEDGSLGWRPLKEYEEEEWAEKYLIALSADFRGRLVAAAKNQPLS